MRAASCIALFVLITMAQGHKPRYDTRDAPALFTKFIQDYNRQYKDDNDREVHYQAFVRMLNVINKANALSPSLNYSINKLADYTPEEIAQLQSNSQPEQQ